LPIDSSTAPGWTLDSLLTALGDRQGRYNRLNRYYRGDCDLPESARQHRQAYQQFQKKARTNFPSLIVEAVRERMQPVGFRTGGTGTDELDAEAWRIWQANSLDADSAQVHRNMLAMSDAYVIVGGTDPELEAPVITPEDPRQVITAHDPIQPRKVTAALKVFTDRNLGIDRAFLYLPGVVMQAVRESSQWTWDASGWEWFGDPQRLPLPVVPVVRFPNRPNWQTGETLGEFEDVLDVLDRINDVVLQRLIIIRAQAFRQRAILGEMPETDSQGNAIDYKEIFRNDPGALWTVPSDVTMWESGQADLTPVLTAARHDIQDVAAITRTPLFYLTPDAANGSAEGASLMREGLVFKTNDRNTEAGEAWERVVWLALKFAGQAPGRDLEVKWANPERFSLAERYDAAVKAQAAEVPWRTRMTEILQFSPQDTDRMEAERATDVLLSPAPAVAPPAITTEVQPVP
jgi:hypothetical protein